MGTRRCSICNITNDRHMAIALGESSAVAKHFKKDPEDPTAYICLKCHEEIQDALMELNLEDEKDKKIV